MSEFIKKHKLLTDVVILVLICILMLVALEIRQPYFFLQDDNADSYICQYVHSLRSASQGQLPFYNFHQLGGIPFLDRGQTGELNVFVYIGGILSQLFLGHLCGTVDFTASLYLIAGAAGMFLFLKKKTGIADYVAMMGAIAWSFNSFSIYCGSNWIISIILTGCFPWMVLSTVYLSENNGLKAILLAAIPKVFMFYSGHPQYFIYAIIFDYLFGLSYLFFFTPKGNKLKTECRFTLKYFLSGLVITLWSLPLLGPMFRAMIISVDRTGAPDINYFIEYRFRLEDFFLSLVYPVMQYDVTGFKQLIGKEAAVVDEIIAIQKNMAHIGIVLFLIVLLGLVRFISSFSRRLTKEEKTLYRWMYSLLPVAVISFLWGGTKWFNMIIYHIPMLNRFRYPFKVMQIFLFFLIMFACLSLQQMISGMKKQKKAKAVSITLLVIECINLLAVYFILPVRFFGLYTNSPKPFTEPLYDDLCGSRYVTVLDSPFFWKENPETLEERSQRVPHDTAALLSYNYATYYGLDCVSGYDLLTSIENVTASDVLLYYTDSIGGSVGYFYDGFVDHMRSKGVRYYVTLTSNADTVEEELSSYGITRWAEDDNRVIFIDGQEEPLAFSGDDYGDVTLEEHINYLEVTTPESFEGGKVTVNYTHNRDFIATVDGQETAITDSGDYHDMIVDGVPSGSHKIVFRYVEHTFRNCLMVSAAGTAVLAVLLYVTGRKKRNENK
ncbi:MAG: hypothetical protein K6F79_09230 [Saccharofermentans sp.]|nr:hypothetical protein [Saccharofermentans sp.]